MPILKLLLDITLMIIISKIKKVVWKNLNSKFLILSILLFLNSLLEVIGIGMIIPIYNLTVNFEDFSKDLSSSYPFLSFLLVHEKNSILISLFTTFLCLIILKYIVYIFSNKFAINLTADLKSKITSKIFKYYTTQPYIFFKNRSSSIIIRDLLKEVTEFCDRFILGWINFYLEAFVVFFVLIFLMYMESIIVLYFFVYVSICSFLFYFLIRKKIKRAGNLRNEIDEKKFSILQNFIKNVKSIKIKNKESFFSNLFEQYIFKFEKTFAQFNFVQILSKPFLEFVGLSFIIVWTIIELYLNTSLVDLFLSLSLLILVCIRILPSINKMIFNLGQIKFASPSKKIIFNELVNIEKSKINIDAKKMINFKNSLELQNIHFGYLDKNFILNNINFKISRGEKICVIGPSGSGKTTFIEILAGLLKPIKGKIQIDKVHEFNFEKNIMNMMYVPQDLLLIDGTIAQNISLSYDDIDKEKLENSIKLSGLKDFIGSQKNKENTDVGELGNKLSGGQKQRIGLARCFYDDSDVIIFDESLNAVDESMKKNLVKNIFNYFKSKTVIFVLHDKSFIDYFDRVIEINKSNLKEINLVDE